MTVHSGIATGNTIGTKNWVRFGSGLVDCKSAGRWSLRIAKNDRHKGRKINKHRIGTKLNPRMGFRYKFSVPV